MKNQPAARNWEIYKRKQLKNPEVRNEYEKLDLEFQVVNTLIGARIECGVTQQELARMLDTKQSVISRAEGMNSLPSLTLLRRIADALGYKVEIRFKKKRLNLDSLQDR